MASCSHWAFLCVHPFPKADSPCNPHARAAPQAQTVPFVEDKGPLLPGLANLVSSPTTC